VFPASLWLRSASKHAFDPPFQLTGSSQQIADPKASAPTLYNIFSPPLAHQQKRARRRAGSRCWCRGIRQQRIGDIPVDETALLINHIYQPADTPYFGTHAIYIWEGCTRQGIYLNALPEVMQGNVLSLRACNEKHFLKKADRIEKRFRPGPHSDQDYMGTLLLVPEQ